MRLRKTTFEPNPPPLFCRFFGHRWTYDGWWKMDEGWWRRHRTCTRCWREETWKTNTKEKPLDVVED